MAQTERFTCAFTVKEFADGTPWIAVEPLAGTLSCLGDGFLGLDLKPGTDYRKAEEIAAFLNQAVAGVSYTRFDSSDYSK